MVDYNLSEGQFAIDGYVFGSATDEAVVLTNGWEQGSYEVRDQDVPSPTSDQVLFGRDRITPGSWRFTIACRRDGDALGVARSLARKWRGDAVRATPGARQTLAFCQNGRTWLVYGRGRQFDIEAEEVTDHDFKVVNCVFRLADQLVYSGSESSATLGLVSTAIGTTGLVLPAVLPWETLLAPQERRGIVTINTDLATPFSVTIYGPTAGQANNFKVWSADWSIGLDAVLGSGDRIDIDTRTGRMTRNRAPFGLSTPGTNLRAVLSPGPQELVFTANDPTNTASAVVRWREVSVLA